MTIISTITVITIVTLAINNSIPISTITSTTTINDFIPLSTISTINDYGNKIPTNNISPPYCTTNDFNYINNQVKVEAGIEVD